MADMEPVPAATVVLVRETESRNDLEILLLLRNSKLAFHGGHWVFPGGRIDADDFAQCEQPLEYPAALKAAVRETQEEAGITIDEKHLVHTAHWTTPPNLPRRFCTWFFVCPVTEVVSVSVDNDEILDHRWISPREALRQAEEEILVLPRPTTTTLKDFTEHRNLEELMQDVSSRSIRVFPQDSDYYRPAEMGYPD